MLFERYQGCVGDKAHVGFQVRLTVRAIVQKSVEPLQVFGDSALLEDHDNMTDPIEGRWWLDFSTQPPRDPSGNEFILSGGKISLAKSGQAAGTYQLTPAALTMTIPMQAMPDEGPWRMEARFLLAPADRPAARLNGIIRAVGGDGRVILNDACVLVRKGADA